MITAPIAPAIGAQRVNKGPNRQNQTSNWYCCDFIIYTKNTPYRISNQCRKALLRKEF